ncbi:MAG: DUF488 domain-containing protein [Scytonema sp. CRU_2_7]|nr:DUF488 domain-containing protein [Scytonema sp. CRU_2_7]
MLHRQKALLLILQQVGFTASTLQVMKWAFLLSHETSSHGGKNFYQFIPYRYGPYSFTLNQETDSLIRNGFLEKGKNNCWSLTDLGKKLNVNLPTNVAQDIHYVATEYGNLSSQELLDLVYDKYSWFTVNSDLPGRRKKKRPVAEKAIYTAGYEGKTVDEFLNLLMESGISQLIDVRFNPISRRYGFHKSTLARLCSFLGIDYQHLPELGIPGSERDDLNSSAKYTSLFNNYRSSLPLREDALLNVTGLLKSKPSVLVCMEADPKFCHRNVLAQHLTTLIDMPINHLGCPA